MTILFGGLTWKHEWLIESVFESAGYRVEVLPTPDVAAFPAREGVRQQRAVQPDLFHGRASDQVPAATRSQRAHASGDRRQLRVLYGRLVRPVPLRHVRSRIPARACRTPASTDSASCSSSRTTGSMPRRARPGLKFTVDFGMGASTRSTSATSCNDVVTRFVRTRSHAGTPTACSPRSWRTCRAAIRDRSDVRDRGTRARVARQANPRPTASRDSISNTLRQDFRPHLAAADRATPCRPPASASTQIEVDRLRVKPLVKITGEFWAQTTEGDGNFHMFQFLEREGAEVMVEPIANWIMYLLWQAESNTPTAAG